MKITKTFVFTSMILLLITPLILFAQDEDLFPGGKYDSNIPTPLDIIGHRFGDLITFHWEMANFIHAIAEATDRVEVKSYGKTYQGRELYYIIISSPENMNRLEEIRKANLRLTDPRKTDRSEADQIASWLPSIIWLGYNIHGNEVTGMEAAIRTVYQLAAGTDDITQNILKNTVCIIDPVQNPDGHDRWAHTVRSVVTVKSHPEPMDTEHSSPWPGGRTNHYLFDLNRDFFLKTQIESLQKTKVYHEWMPHVFPDLHEMGSNSTYFFAPPMTPYNEYVKPELKKWWDIIAQANAQAFDHFGWGYYTKESFDAFYPGYGVSYPSINGSIGMTYEEASSRGVSIKRDDGSILTLREGSWHHFTTSMATIQIIAERREEKVKDFYKFFTTALAEAASDPMKEIILVPDNDPQIAAKLINNLLIEGVEISRATKSFTNKKATSYMSKKTVSKTFPGGSYIISLNQPQKILIKALLAPNSPITKEFIKEEEERKSLKERSHFYDVTAWSMPLTFGVDAYWTSAKSNIQSEPVTSQPLFSGKIIDGPAKQVYLIPYNTLSASKLLIKLCEGDYKVRMARKTFSINGKEWPKGTLVVRVNRNPESLHQRLTELAKEFSINITAVHSGLSDSGIDLGSNNIVTLKKAKIALLTESPVSSYSYGAIHYLFEREFDLYFTRINARNLANLNDYNVVVIPSGNYSSTLSKSQLNNFVNWIRSGGTVVTVSGATRWLQQDSLSRTKILNDTPDPDNKDKKIQPDRTPGAIVKVNLNQNSFLSYGCPPAVAALIRSNTIYLPFKDDDMKNVGLYAPIAEMKLSGFIWPETEKYLAEKVFLYNEPYGRGKLIMFTEDPNFRASYDGLNKLFLNAILLAPSMN